MNKVKLCAVDAVYHKEGPIVNALNAFLDNYPFGPYDHLSEAAREVQRLRKKGKDKKADELKGLLQRFSVSRGVDQDSFEELPALMDLMRESTSNGLVLIINPARLAKPT
ncbi:hypothetical protein HYH02_003384 [Chlamydomonas schloesseri]|uniref:Uncharacterized protein n=1 Tax=Chlamydomonas schloesseri TaxID=2026947 RepID=A0A836BA55_9CHLO|nr:hypothetical protein HYH02_003384 [Chlamydomonas schloesseri]|eukprot:KAG2452362.1 hypothetical protein HYH02_003384 [Chlamydomonas schloesseri]